MHECVGAAGGSLVGECVERCGSLPLPLRRASPRSSARRSLELLYGLGALDATGSLTDDVGKPMAKLPVGAAGWGVRGGDL